jgi:hypothetical protein
MNYWCPMCRVDALGWPLVWRWSNPDGDELLACPNCEYEVVYRIRTGQCEPHPEHPSNGWLPPLGWSPPQPSESARPLVESSASRASAAPTGTEPTTGRLENRHADESAEEKVVRQMQNSSRADALTPPTADGIDAEPNATTDVGTERTTPTPTRTQADHRTDRDQGPSTAAEDATRDGQDQSRCDAERPIADILRILRDAEALRVDPGLDPLRKGRALAQFAHQAIATIERNDRVVVRKRSRAIAFLQQILGDEEKKFRADPHVDPIRRARLLTEFMREDRRAIEARNRLVAEMHQSFDFAAMLEEVWKEVGPEIERKRRQYLSEQDDTEMFANEPDGPAPTPS